MITNEPLSGVVLRAPRNLIANSYAMTSQSTGQYRAALLRHVDDLVVLPSAANCASACPSLQPQASVVMLDGDQQTAAQVAPFAKPRNG